MSETPKKSDKQSKRDARLKTFLRRAGPVIAAERGLTSTARIKLQTIAAEMRLPGELLEEALTELQTETRKKRQYTRWERGFAKYLASQLKKLDNRILTFEREQKAIQVAEEKYQLDHPQAQEIISEVAKQLEIRRISASEAERHVETTVKEKVGQGVWIDLESRERLYMLGEEWGLSKEHVAAVIDHYIRSNKDRKSVEQRRSSLFVAAIGVVFLGLLATTLYVGVQYSLNPESSEQNKGNETRVSAVGWGNLNRQLGGPIDSALRWPPQSAASQTSKRMPGNLPPLIRALEKTAIKILSQVGSEASSEEKPTTASKSYFATASYWSLNRK